MKYFVDTNIFLRTLVREDEKSFKECYQFLEAIKINRIEGITASVVLAEIAWTLSSYYKFPRKKVVQAVRSVIDLRGLRIIDGYNHLLALNLFESKRVKYIDALIASVEEIRAKEWPIISYDKDFDKLEVKRIEPEKI